MADSEDGAEAVRAELWSAFPVAQEPRPIVFADSRVRLGERGFIDDASKRAYLDGAIESDVELPAGVLGALIDGRRSRDRHVSLRVTSAVSTRGSFLTDRGPRLFPAYRVQVTGLNQPCIVLDPTVEIWWPQDQQRDLAVHAGHATIEPDGVIIHFQTGGGALTEFLSANFTEHAAFVRALAVTRQRLAKPGRAITLNGTYRQVTGHLADPLGNRVLVDERGYPYVVTAHMPARVDIPN